MVTLERLAVRTSLTMLSLSRWLHYRDGYKSKFDYALIEQVVTLQRLAVRASLTMLSLSRWLHYRDGCKNCFDYMFVWEKYGLPS